MKPTAMNLAVELARTDGRVSPGLVWESVMQVAMSPP